MRTSLRIFPRRFLFRRPRLAPVPLVYGGFTLVELLVVIVIIAVLMALAFPAARGVLEKGRQAACLGNLRGLGAMPFGN